MILLPARADSTLENGKLRQPRSRRAQTMRAGEPALHGFAIAEQHAPQAVVSPPRAAGLRPKLRSWSSGRYVFLVLAMLHEIIDHGRIGQCRDVAKATGFIL